MKTGPRIAALSTVVALGVASCSSSTGGGEPTTTPPGTRTAGGGCATGADYCDTFADPHSGWPTASTANGAAAYSAGAYRVSAQHLTTVLEAAPVSIGKVAPNGSVQVDVDAATGHFVTPASLGISCWARAGDLGAPTGGFTFLVDDLGVTLSRTDDSGTEQKVAYDDAPGALKVDGRRNHLTARCVRSTGKDGAVQVELQLSIGGTVVLGATYSDSTLTAAGFGDRVAVVVHGHKDEVLFDNFALRAAS